MNEKNGVVFKFFKGKKGNEFVFPENYIDIHSHLIPGIDDGAESVLNSIELIKELEKRNKELYYHPSYTRRYLAKYTKYH